MTALESMIEEFLIKLEQVNKLPLGIFENDMKFLGFTRKHMSKIIEIIRVQREALESISGCKPAGQHNDGLGHIAMIDMVILPTAKQTIKRCDEIAGKE